MVLHECTLKSHAYHTHASLASLRVESWRMTVQFNYVWQGGYFPPAVQSAPQFHSTCSNLQQVNSQPSQPFTQPIITPSVCSSTHSMHICVQPSPQSSTNFYLKIFNPATKGSFSYIPYAIYHLMLTALTS